MRIGRLSAGAIGLVTAAGALLGHGPAAAADGRPEDRAEVARDTAGAPDDLLTGTDGNDTMGTPGDDDTLTGGG
jgi:hypothetical protein